MAHQRVFRIRPVNLDLGNLKTDGFTILDVVVATDAWVGIEEGEEKLVITDESVVLDQFASTGLNIILDHESNGVNLGKAINPTIRDGKLRGDLQFDKNVPEAMRLFDSIVNQGIAKDASIEGNNIELNSVRMGQSMSHSITITKWEPTAVSFVGEGADPGCGVYRSKDKVTPGESNKKEESINSKPMTTETKANAETAAEDKVQVNAEPEVSRAKTIDKTEAAKVAPDDGIQRAKALRKIASDNNLDDQTYFDWLEKGFTDEQAKSAVYDMKIARAKVKPPVRFTGGATDAPKNPHTEGGVSLTMRAAISAAVKKKFGVTDFTKAEGLACEVSQDFQDDYGGPGFRIPYTADLKRAAFKVTGTGSDTAGANFVTTNVQMQDLEKFLYENTVTEQLNIKTRTGQTALYQIPRIDSIGKASYIAENGKATETNTTTSNILLSPVPVVAMKSRTNLAEVLAPGTTAELQDELMEQIRIAVDQAILVGADNGPTGITDTGSIDLSASTTSGLRLTATTKLLEMETVRNVMSRIRAAKVKGPLSIVASEPIINRWANQTVGAENKNLLWARNADTTTVAQRPGFIQNTPVYVSYNLDKTGSEAGSRAIIGAFQYCYSVYWGQSMKMTVGEQTEDFEHDRISFRLVSYHNSAVSREAAFAAYQGVKV